jgi:peptidyl-prolyl cis-trans isomerase D
MLNLFRQGGVMKALMGVIVVLIIGAFALDYRTSVTMSGDDCVAEMDGTCIELGAYQTLLRLVAPPGATNKELREAGFVKYAVDALVERELLLQEAERIGVGISEEELDALLSLGRVHFSWPADAPIPNALAVGRPFPKTGASPTVTYLRVTNSDTGAFDYDIYKRQVQSRLRLSTKAFKEAQEAEVIAARVRELVTNPVRVSEDEVWTQYAREKSSATARVVEAEAEWFQRFAVSLKDADVDTFAAGNGALIDEAWASEQKQWTGDCAVVSELLYEFAPGADDEGKAKTKARAEQAVKLLDDVDFALVAQLTSDAENATSGGALGCLLPDYGPDGANLLSAVEVLAPDSTSAILASPKGHHVFRFHGKLNKEDAERMGRRALVRRLASERAAKERAKAFAVKLIELAKGGGELAKLTTEQADASITLPLEDEEVMKLARELAMASDLVPTMEVSRTFGRGGTPVFGVKDDFDVAAAMFALGKGDELLPQPVETHTGFAVLQLKEKTEATREEFEKEKTELLQAARELRRAEVLARYVARLRERIKLLKLNPKHTGEAQDGEGPNTPAEPG